MHFARATICYKLFADKQPPRTGTSAGHWGRAAFWNPGTKLTGHPGGSFSSFCNRALGPKPTHRPPHESLLLSAVLLVLALSLHTLYMTLQAYHIALPCRKLE